MIRKPVVAGQFYDASPEMLKKSIEASFKSEFGPGELPTWKRKGVILGAVSPHAGYMFSGPGAAHVFKAIAELEFADVYILLGTNHTGLGKTSVLMQDWETPLGIVKTDIEFGKQLIKNAKIVDDDLSHMREHSIEVQLPFLQYASKDKINELRICCISVSSPSDIEPLAKGIRKTTDDCGKKVCIIASSDFTHYGFNYGYVPFTENIRKNLEKLDSGAIDLIKKMDADGFVGYIRKTGATICGFMPIAVLIKTLKGKSKNAELLKYYTSADIVGDYGNSVSYASLVFR